MILTYSFCLHAWEGSGQGRAEGPKPPNDWGGPGLRGARPQAQKKENVERRKRKKEMKVNITKIKKNEIIKNNKCRNRK